MFAPAPRVTAAAPALRISKPGDAHEREAERAAARTEAPAQIERAPRRTAPAGAAGGDPIPSATRARFESVYGYDFGRVRVHTDAAAARATAAVGALAFTHRGDIAFGAGQYAPDTTVGRRLLAHELAHVAQQAGGGPIEGGALSAAEPGIQRACPATTCPPISVPWPAGYPLSYQAEKCIQGLYQDSHPGSLVSYNKDWVSLTATGVGGPALTCVQQKWFNGPSGINAGEPDIWDFTNGTMYEITTPSGAAFRIGKLGAEVALATSLTSTADCGGSSFARGTWAPPGPCYSLGGDFYISVHNAQGVLIYNLVKDAAKEASLAAMLALLAAGVKSGMFQSMGKGLLGAAGKKLLPGYAIASVTAALVLIASGRAEAKIGGGGGEPLIELFKALEAKGEPVPPEVQQMIESDPELKKLVEDAIKDGGDPTEAQKKLSAKMLKLIADNKDQFTAEELKALLATTQSAGKAMPKGDVTVETLKKLAKAKGVAVDGKPTPVTTGSGTGTGTGTGTTGTTGTTGGLSKASTDLISNAGPGAKLLFDGLFGKQGSGAKGPKVTDADVAQFFSLIPNDIDSAKAKTILAKTEPYRSGTISDLLTGLQTASAGELSSVPTDTTAGPGVGGGATASTGSTAAESDKSGDLAKVAKSGDFSGMEEGAKRFQTFKYRPPDIKVGNTLTVTLIAILGKKNCAGIASFRVTEISGLDATALDKVQSFTIDGSYVYSSAFYDKDAAQVAPRNFLVGKPVAYTLKYTPPAPEKKTK